MTEGAQQLPTADGALHRLLQIAVLDVGRTELEALVEQADAELRQNAELWPPEISLVGLHMTVQAWVIVESNHRNDGSGWRAAAELCAALADQVPTGFFWPTPLEAELFLLLAQLSADEQHARDAQATVDLVRRLSEGEQPTGHALIGHLALVWLRQLLHWEKWLIDGFAEALLYIARLSISNGKLEEESFAGRLSSELREAVDTAPFPHLQLPLVELIIEAGEGHLQRAAQSGSAASAEVVLELAGTYVETAVASRDETRAERALRLLDVLIELRPDQQAKRQPSRLMIQLVLASMRGDSEAITRLKKQLERLAEETDDPEVAVEALLIDGESGGSIDVTPERLRALQTLGESGQLDGRWLSRINILFAIEVATQTIDGNLPAERAVEHGRALLKAADQYAFGAGGSRVYSTAVALTETAAVINGDFRRAKIGAMEAMRVLDPEDEQSIDRALRLIFSWWPR